MSHNLLLIKIPQSFYVKCVLFDFDETYVQYLRMYRMLHTYGETYLKYFPVYIVKVIPYNVLLDTKLI